MPQIVEYVNKEGITPTDRGTEARVQQGRRIGASFNQVSESLRQFGFRAGQELGGAIRDAGDAAVAWQDQRQIHQGSTMGAQMLLNLSDSHTKDTYVDPNDPAYSSKVDMLNQQWRENKLEPTLDQFQQGFTTQKSQQWAEQHIDQIRQHFYQTGAADVARAASLGTVTGIKNEINNLAAAVEADPTLAPLAHKMLDSSINGRVSSAHGLSNADAGNILGPILQDGHRQIANTAAESAISRAPNPIAEGQRQIRINGGMLTPGQTTKIAKDAETRQKANLSYDRANASYARQQQNDAAHIANNKSWAENVQVDPDNPYKLNINPKYIADSADLPRKFPGATQAIELAQARVHWADEMVKRQESGEKATTWPGEYQDLLLGITADVHPTTEKDIYDLEAAGKLSRPDAEIAMKIYKTVNTEPLQTPEFKTTMKAVEEELGVGVMGDSHIRLASFMSQFLPEYQKMVRTGTVPPGALNLNDPNSFISKSLDQFRPNQNELLMGRELKKMGAGANPQIMQDLIQNIQGVKPTTIRRGGQTITMPFATGAPAPVIKPPAEREVNKVYPTPQGPMKWTGTGWVKP